MDEDTLKRIMGELESKEKDCIAFSKRYKQRNMEDLHQYYEGAEWAIKFAINLLKEAIK